MESGEGAFEILKEGKWVYAQEGWKFYIGPFHESPEDENPPVGRDITGDGQPNLIVSEWTGGINSCMVSSVFEIGGNFRKIGTFNGVHTEPVFRDVNCDGSMEILVDDWAFDYWYSLADSPTTRIVLEFRNGSYQMARRLMRKPAPAPAELKTKTAELQASNSWPYWNNRHLPSCTVMCYMLDLIYSGNAKSAWEFLDMGWPKDAPGKERFLHCFRSTLEDSTYWPEIRAMNRN